MQSSSLLAEIISTWRNFVIFSTVHLSEMFLDEGGQNKGQSWHEESWRSSKWAQFIKRTDWKDVIRGGRAALSKCHPRRHNCLTSSEDAAIVCRHSDSGLSILELYAFYGSASQSILTYILYEGLAGKFLSEHEISLGRSQSARRSIEEAPRMAEYATRT